MTLGMASILWRVSSTPGKLVLLCLAGAVTAWGLTLCLLTLFRSL